MVETLQSRSSILVIGTLGIGKSSLLNFILGKDHFKAGDQASGLTQEWNEIEFTFENQNYTVIDTPGTNDPEMSFIAWVTRLRKWGQENPGRNFQCVLLAFKATYRPTVGQRLDMITVLDAVTNVSLKNMAFIFTFCDMINMDDKNEKGVVFAEAFIDVLMRTTLGCDYPSFNESRNQKPLYFTWSRQLAEAPENRKKFLNQLTNCFFTPKTPQLELNFEFNLLSLGDAIESTGDVQMIGLFEQEMEEMTERIAEAADEADQLSGMQQQTCKQDFHLAEFMKITTSEMQFQQQLLEQSANQVAVQKSQAKKKKKESSFTHYMTKCSSILQNTSEKAKVIFGIVAQVDPRLQQVSTHIETAVTVTDAACNLLQSKSTKKNLQK